MEHITLEKVNSYLLSRQHLSSGKSADIVRITGDICGLHATGAAEPYLALFARSAGFRREMLNEQLYTKKTLFKVRCMRSTLYILVREMLPSAFAATYPMVEKQSRRYAEYLGLDMNEYPGIETSIIDILHGKPATITEIKRYLQRKDLHLPSILNLMCDQGILVRLQGSWKSQSYRYTLFKEFFPGMDLWSISETEGIKQLLRAYLYSFGPATEDDIAWWTGLTKARIVPALNELTREIMQIGIYGLKGEFVVLKSEYEEMCKHQRQEDRIISVLPILDPYLMGYKKRERYLDHRYYDMVFDNGGNATTTVLLDGNITGIWDIDEKESLCKLFLLKKVPAKTAKNVISKLSAMGEFITGRPVMVKPVSSMIPLTQRSSGGFMSPLKNSK